jgi:heme/copper-type cytochrome/quinol oxidase subunit 2
MKFYRIANFAFRLGAVTAALAATGLAQCAMCKANVANAENAAEVSGTINAAVLVLLIPTLLVIGGLVRLVFKYRHSSNSYVHFRSTDTQRDFE